MSQVGLDAFELAHVFERVNRVGLDVRADLVDVDLPDVSSHLGRNVREFPNAATAEAAPIDAHGADEGEALADAAETTRLQKLKNIARLSFVLFQYNNSL